MEIFDCRTKLLCGKGAVAALKDMDIRRLLLVSDPYFTKGGQAQKIAALANAAEYELFDKVIPDPTVELAAQGTALLRSFDADTVVALGGGSAMDLAKAMVYFSGKEVRLIAIPTTSGSGSEVTDFSVLTHGQIKHPLVDSRIRPQVAILDSDLLQHLPKNLIADAGFDVLSHALESYVATGAGAVTDALSSDAFCCAYNQLAASFSGDTAVRQRIHTAATMAGMAFTQSGLGLCHAMAHALGGVFHIPHGRLNAILLPAVISCNAHVAGAKYAKLARQAGLGGSVDTVAVRNLKNGLVRLRRELQMPETLAQAGVDPRQIWHETAGIVKAVLSDPCCKTNPLLVEDFMVRRILDEVTGRV